MKEKILVFTQCKLPTYLTYSKTDVLFLEPDTYKRQAIPILNSTKAYAKLFLANRRETRETGLVIKDCNVRKPPPLRTYHWYYGG